MRSGPKLQGEAHFPNGETRPTLGLGTCGLGEAPERRAAELRAMRLALEMGWRVIDTAEMYGQGGAEALMGQAVAEAMRTGIRRSDLFIVSKALPEHASASGLRAACEASLRRLQLDQIDLYLLHWRGAVPLADTVRGFEELQRRGLIRLWGVSNFDLDGMRELSTVPGGRACATNQVYYSLSQRGVAYDLLPWQRVQQMPLMAYSPFDQGELVDHPRLRPVAERHRATPAQVALAWLLHQPGVVAIPKAGNVLHLRHNWAARQLRLTAQDLAELDLHFPPPQAQQRLAMR